METGEVKRMVKVAFNNNRVGGKTMRLFNTVEKLMKHKENIRKRKLTLNEFIKVLDQLPTDRRPLSELRPWFASTVRPDQKGSASGRSTFGHL